MKNGEVKYVFIEKNQCFEERVNWRDKFDFLNIKAAQNMKTEMINFSVSFIKGKKLKNNNTVRTTTIS